MKRFKSFENYTINQKNSNLTGNIVDYETPDMTANIDDYDDVMTPGSTEIKNKLDQFLKDAEEIAELSLSQISKEGKIKKLENIYDDLKNFLFQNSIKTNPAYSEIFNNFKQEWDIITFTVSCKQ